MQNLATTNQGSRAPIARPLLVLVVLALFSHLLVLIFLPHRVLPSNLFQLFFPLLAVAVSLHQRLYTFNAVGRRCWSAIAAAFGIWSAAQALFIYFLYFPELKIAGVRLDDALWVLFGPCPSGFGRTQTRVLLNSPLMPASEFAALASLVKRKA